MQIIKNIFKYLVYIFLIIFFGFFCLTLFGFNFGVVVSDSMQPALNKSDLVLINPHKSIKQGDIVAFNLAEAGFVIHRVLRVQKDSDKTYYLCAGDNNAFYVSTTKGEVNLSSWQDRAAFLNQQPIETAIKCAENVVEDSDIIGIAVVKFNNMGNFMQIFLNNNPIIIMLIILALIFAFNNKKIAKNTYFRHIYNNV